jgi:FlaA1/EpsC-like NDP-sugar epimerase
MMDSFLILIGIALGSYLRFFGAVDFISRHDFMVLRMMLVVLVVQICFYYFDLYDFKGFREKKKMGVLLLGALFTSSIVLAVIYYIFPFLAIGRGIFATSMVLILILTFFWRVIYSMILKVVAPKERLLIIGTGELAKKIKSEILDNGYEGFEIVGFIDENRDNVGRKV